MWRAHSLGSSHQVMDVLPGDLVVLLGVVFPLPPPLLSLICHQEAGHLLSWNPDRLRLVLWKDASIYSIKRQVPNYSQSR